MLYQRILTAIPLAAFVFWIIFYQPTTVFFAFVLFIVLIAGYEWSKLSGVQNMAARFVYAATITLLIWAVQRYLSDFATWFVYAAGFWWLLTTGYLMKATPKPASDDLKAGRLLVAFVVLPAAAFAMQQVHAMYQGAEWLFYALSLVWVADIGAYFSGKKFGKNKLAPNISPGKTKEGLLGAVITTSLYTIAASFYFALDVETAALLVLMSIVLTFISVTGDLYFSFLKREAGLKDSGKILPGHGGILDRVDSLLAALPVFLLGYNWLISSNPLLIR